MMNSISASPMMNGGVIIIASPPAFPAIPLAG